MGKIIGIDLGTTNSCKKDRIIKRTKTKNVRRN